MKEKKVSKKKMNVIIIIMLLIGGLVLAYNPLIKYLSAQAENPNGFIGNAVTKIWSSYFDNLSQWTIDSIKMNNSSNILDVGYGGGSNIRNLVDADKDLQIFGVDISRESYKTTYDLNQEAIEDGTVELSIADVAKMDYEDTYFDYVFAIQTHMYWGKLEIGLKECFRVLKDGGTFIITSEIDKIDYHLPKYKDAEKFKQLLVTIGFSDVRVHVERNYIRFICLK